MASSPPSLTDCITPLEAGAEVVAGGFLGQIPALALADGTIVLAAADAVHRIKAHPDAVILMARSLGKRLVTGGDDGRVVEIHADGAQTVLADEKGQWIDGLALRADGATAWTRGKAVTARDAKGALRHFTAPSSVRGLCFLGKGYRLAMAHYNGVSLWFPNTDATPDDLVWRGSHLDVTISPDGRFAVSAMQEHSLHGWRIADKKDMRMTGYPAKTRSFSWSSDGLWLATSGAEACVVWPFEGKDGPMGRGPRECGTRPARVSRVAFHPQSLVLAVGYEDGAILICRLSDAAEISARGATEDKGGAISTLAWNADGRRLLFGTEDGAAGVVDIPA